jgi:hypothetical protein
MTTAEKLAKLAEMPEDYRPNKPLVSLPIDMDKADGFDMLDRAEAGEVLVRLFAYARDYADSFDASMEPDYTGLTRQGAFMLRLCCNSFKRMEDNRRETSYLRSGANGGGRTGGN